MHPFLGRCIEEADVHGRSLWLDIMAFRKAHCHEVPADTSVCLMRVDGYETTVDVHIGSCGFGK